MLEGTKLLIGDVAARVSSGIERWHSVALGLALFALAASPTSVRLAEADLSLHHLAHWTFAASGAVLMTRVRPPRLRRAALWAPAVLVALFAAHMPWPLTWAEANPVRHSLSHLGFVVLGGCLCWTLRACRPPHRAWIAILGSALMWLFALAGLGGALQYPDYPGQGGRAGVAMVLEGTAFWVGIIAWPWIEARPRRLAVLAGTGLGAALAAWTVEPLVRLLV